MKNYITWSLLFLLTACLTLVNRDDAGIRFNEQGHDFGSPGYKKAVEYQFEFSNPGETALIVSDVKNTCGCTIAGWTKTPVKPGKSEIISVKYDAASPGLFYKKIGVYYNGISSPVILKIKGEVIYNNDSKKHCKR
ncbi:MAG: DUF1573 domain-containing protein [Mangrovibacterium sp.]